MEPPYTVGLSSSHFVSELRKEGITPEIRRRSLRRLLEIKPLSRILEVHNGLTGLIAEETRVELENEYREFDGMWSSSLTDSTSKGKPDNSAIDISSHVQTIKQILKVTTKPIIINTDNNKLNKHFQFTIKTLKQLGVSAVIIEDKVGPKRNSLLGSEVEQFQDSPSEFSEKIRTGKISQVTNEFMIIARIESLILQRGMEDALARAKAYVRAGSDGIMIHSKAKESAEVLEFTRQFKKFSMLIPLVVVPTTYNAVTEKELEKAGINIVIYANHLLRSAYPAMALTARTILKNGRSLEVDPYCLPINEIVKFIPITR